MGGGCVGMIRSVYGSLDHRTAMKLVVTKITSGHCTVDMACNRCNNNVFLLDAFVCLFFDH